MASNKKSLVWTKMSGAGNSFWITHLLSSDLQALSTDRDWSQKAFKLCQQPATQADGIAILLPSKTCDFKWLFYNADGSPAEMCGNLACCVTEYVFKKKLLSSTKPSILFETPAGTVKGMFSNPQSGFKSANLGNDLSLNPIKKQEHIKQAQVFLKTGGKATGPWAFSFKKEDITYSFINSGVPHAVIKLKVWPSSHKEWDRHKALAQALRKSVQNHKNGMNVTFYATRDRQNTAILFPQQNMKTEIFHTIKQGPTTTLIACSFERGVEDWTLACGTGALAVAQVYVQESHPSHLSSAFKQEAFLPILVQMPGGVLQVGFHPDIRSKQVSLISPVQWLEERIEDLEP